MTIKEYLESIGRMTPGESAITSNIEPSQGDEPFQEKSIDKNDNSVQCVGEIFDMLNARNKTIPANMQINVKGWPGRPFEGRYEQINNINK